MVSWYSGRNQGMYIHLHPDCALGLGDLVREGRAKEQVYEDE